MRVFVGWSGSISHQVAMALRDWLPTVIPGISVFVSTRDIAKGGRWGEKLSRELDAADCGILCVTPENVDSTWLAFEAGALTAREDGETPVLPFLLGLETGDLTGPMAQFQATAFNREDVRQLVLQLAGSAAESVPAAFDRAWTTLTDAVEHALGSVPPDPLVEVFGPDALTGEGLNLTYGELALVEFPGEPAILKFRYTKPGTEEVAFSIDKPVSSCDLRASNYLARTLSRTGTAAISLHSDVELRERLDLSFVAFGGPLSNHKTTDVLKNAANRLLTFDQQHCAFHGVENRWDTVEREAGFDYGLILKIHPCQFPERTWITCAGIGEWGTSGAAWYLANRWPLLHERAGASPFAAVVRVEPGRDESGEEVDFRTE